jgi:hypothetical protein
VTQKTDVSYQKENCNTNQNVIKMGVIINPRKKNYFGKKI